MPFITLNEYTINIDHIFYFQEDGEGYQVYFGAGSEKPRCVYVKKGTKEAHTLVTSIPYCPRS